MVSAAILAIIAERGFLVHWPASSIFANTANEVFSMVEFSEVSFNLHLIFQTQINNLN